MTTGRDKDQRLAPDQVQREFTATGTNRLWLADMTCVLTWAGIVCLTVVLDVCSRKMVGWAFGRRWAAWAMRTTTPWPRASSQVLNVDSSGGAAGSQPPKRAAIFTWIEGWYDPRRRHKGISHKFLINFEEALHDKANAAPPIIRKRLPSTKGESP